MSLSLLNTLGRELPIIGDTLGHITLLLAQSVQLIIYFSIPFFINAQMTIIVILFSLAFFVVILFLNRISFRLGKKNMDTANKTFSFLNEVLSAIKLVFSYYTQNKSKNTCQGSDGVSKRYERGGITHVYTHIGI